MSAQCVVCGSKRLIEQTRLSTCYSQSSSEVRLHMPPRGPMGLIEVKTSVRGSTCVDCGHVQFRAVDREELLTAYQHQQLQLVNSES